MLYDLLRVSNFTDFKAAMNELFRIENGGTVVDFHESLSATSRFAFLEIFTDTRFVTFLIIFSLLLLKFQVQCVLVINMFLEKIFIFLWLWILFLAFLSAVNLAAWLATVAVPFCRQAFVEKYLDFGEGEHKSSMEISLFVEKFLRPDGVLLLKMVSIHAGNIMSVLLNF